MGEIVLSFGPGWPGSVRVFVCCVCRLLCSVNWIREISSLEYPIQMQMNIKFASATFSLMLVVCWLWAFVVADCGSFFVRYEPTGFSSVVSGREICAKFVMLHSSEQFGINEDLIVATDIHYRCQFP